MLKKLSSLGNMVIIELKWPVEKSVSSVNTDPSLRSVLCEVQQIISKEVVLGLTLNWWWGSNF